ncbi:MAG: bifunctional phosphopantothenoylcysteine decarboxylase/phosphopantothenate--cysteine ligase CoaBC [Gloeomargaritaceae cyanobacterium C42_A2020_066]|nr:bifunctional phosphopantothenoylcysteine decarboxylase/phosphopantothenate--cysteine ligase CoaBC [Gloeomargaritaceae cyanobacterium C42_A2020_066]
MTAAGRVLVGIGGGIAAYKVCGLLSALGQTGRPVRAILTPAAERFITPLTVATLCRSPVYREADFWQPNPRPLHIELGEWAELLVIAPLTANALAHVVYGIADDLLMNTLLASTCPVLVAPAMNSTMWQQSAVQRNWLQLLDMPRIHRLGPAPGVLACDAVGIGRMVEPEALVAYVNSLLVTGGRRDLQGKHLLITAGGTREYLDPARFLGNPATGKMGLALAQAAQHRGAQVTLIHGPVSWDPPEGLQVVPVISAADMERAVLEAAPQADWILMAAAVADVRPAVYSPQKLAKQDLPAALELRPAGDILATLSHQRHPRQKVIGFAAQTGEIVSPALEKLQRKNLDAIFANPIDQPDAGFGSDENSGLWLDTRGRQVHLGPCSKLHLAHQILDQVLTL